MTAEVYPPNTLRRASSVSALHDRPAPKAAPALGDTILDMSGTAISLPVSQRPSNPQIRPAPQRAAPVAAPVRPDAPPSKYRIPSPTRPPVVTAAGVPSTEHILSRAEVLESTPLYNAGHLRSLLLAQVARHAETTATASIQSMADERLARMRAEQAASGLVLQLRDKERAVHEAKAIAKEEERAANDLAFNQLETEQATVRTLQARIHALETQLNQTAQQVAKYRGQAEIVVRSVEAKLVAEQDAHQQLQTHALAHAAVAADAGQGGSSNAEEVTRALQLQLSETQQREQELRARTTEDKTALENLAAMLRLRETEIAELRAERESMRSPARSPGVTDGRDDSMLDDEPGMNSTANRTRQNNSLNSNGSRRERANEDETDRAREQDEYIVKLQELVKQQEVRISELSLYALAEKQRVNSPPPSSHSPQPPSFLSMQLSPVRAPNRGPFEREGPLSAVTELEDSVMQEVQADLLTQRLFEQVERTENALANLRVQYDKLERENMRMKFNLDNDEESMSMVKRYETLEKTVAEVSTRAEQAEARAAAAEAALSGSHETARRRQEGLQTQHASQLDQLRAEVEALRKRATAAESAAESANLRATDFQAMYNAHVNDVQMSKSATEQSHALMQQTIVLLKQQLAAKEKDFSKVEEALSSRNQGDLAAEVARLRSQLNDVEVREKLLNEQLTKERTTLGDLQKRQGHMLAEKDTQLSQLKRDLQLAEERCRQLESHGLDASTGDGDVAALQQALRDRDEEIELLTAECEDLRSQLATLEDQFDELLTHAEAKESELQQMRGSS